MIVLLWAAAECALRVLPLSAVCRRFGVQLEAAAPSGNDGRASMAREPHSSPEPRGPEILAPDVAERVEAACSRVDRVLRVARPRDACLRRALVLGHLLRDLKPTLRIGVVRGNGPFEAHAWLELDGVPLPEPSGAGIPVGVVPLRRL